MALYSDRMPTSRCFRSIRRSFWKNILIFCIPRAMNYTTASVMPWNTFFYRTSNGLGTHDYSTLAESCRTKSKPICPGMSRVSMPVSRIVKMTKPEPQESRICREKPHVGNVPTSLSIAQLLYRMQRLLYQLHHLYQVLAVLQELYQIIMLEMACTNLSYSSSFPHRSTNTPTPTWTQRITNKHIHSSMRIQHYCSKLASSQLKRRQTSKSVFLF